ncbi:MAG: AMP-binding protein, partial [Rhodoglobus sp.]
PPATMPPATVPSAVAVVVETSGSTGKPKRVMLSAAALKASAVASDTLLGGPGQWLLAVPAHYIAGINVLTRSYYSGIEPAMMNPEGFSAERFIACAHTLTATRRYTALVPTQLARLLDTPAAITALLTFSRILVGGQSTPPTMLAAARAHGLAITTTYGSSETSGGCVWNGTAVPTAQMRITNNRIELAGPMLAEGYLDDPERTAHAFIERDGTRWYRTDDLGEIVDGVLRVRGRSDDLIISGGVKVSLSDVEAAVHLIPGHSGAVVLAVPHPQWGDVPVVVTTSAIDLAELRQWVSSRISAAAAPSRILLVEEIPLLPSGKPDRMTLVSLLRQ